MKLDAFLINKQKIETKFSSNFFFYRKHQNMAGYRCQYYLTHFFFFFLVVTAHVNFVPKMFFLGGGGGGGGLGGAGGYRGYLREIIFTRPSTP